MLVNYKILPHERQLLLAKLSEGERANYEVSDQMSNAIENGNAWHDNAEYDAAIERMKHIDSSYGPIARLVKGATVVEYPDLSSPVAGLGSLVLYEQFQERYNTLLVSTVLVGQVGYEKAWEQAPLNDGAFEVTSVESPLGSALLGVQAGESTDFEVNGRNQSVQVHVVDQQWVRQFEPVAEQR
jgi:transcription elongation GreA/GreB family factor